MATLVGLAMVAGGVYGLATGDDDDDAGGTSYRSPADEPGFPLATDAKCAQAGRRDPRLRTIRDFVLRPAEGETGTADLTPNCMGSTVQISMQLKGLRSRSEYYYVWLYKDRRRAKHIGALLSDSDGEAFGSGSISPDVNPRGYDEIVVALARFGDTNPRRPRKIVMVGRL